MQRKLCRMTKSTKHDDTLLLLVSRPPHRQLRDAALSMLHIKRHYFGSHPSLNALGIIPAGPPGESAHFSGPTPQHRLLLV